MADDPGLQVELLAIEVSNLRGFSEARLALREGLVLLVGPNNTGKTSILRLLDWVLNRADESVLLGHRQESRPRSMTSSSPHARLASALVGSR